MQGDNYKLYNDTVELQFTQSSHRYKVSIDGGEFKPVRGVTGIIDSFIPKPHLISWAAKLSADTFKAGLTHVLTADAYERDEVINTLYMASKSAHTARKERGGDVGTLVHNFIEQYLTDQNPRTPDDKDAQRSISGFLEWIGKHKPEFISTEQPVYSKTYNFAGTYDAILKLDGKTYMADWKTSDPMKIYKNGKPSGQFTAYPSHMIQCAAYDLAYTDDKTGQPLSQTFAGHMVIYVTKSGKVFAYVNDDTVENKKAFIRGFKLSTRVKNLEYQIKEVI